VPQKDDEQGALGQGALEWVLTSKSQRFIYSDDFLNKGRMNADLFVDGTVTILLAVHGS